MDQSNGEIKQVSIAEKHLISEFLEHAGSSLNSFRYYESRPLQIIENHLCTLLYLRDSSPVGYGHLDKEQNKTWLGVCVAEEFVGLGIGKLLVNELMDFANELNVPVVNLSVDKQNIPAQRLYKKLGFQTTSENDRVIFMTKKLKS